ncbi:hypothetical protein QBC35DRAFT_17484 [Podospora australis]|uniref:NACHT domain-containing protein n=1 Tax=Podospora australis TaxID=1536484 RepID=A0AAN6WS23_9PEZI|nr:hypothetical protein QBC35DRAFT_17484 [Podospora australis]
MMSIRKKSGIEELEAKIDRSCSAALLHLQMLLKEGQLAIQLELSGLQTDAQLHATEITKQLEALLSVVSSQSTYLKSQKDIKATIESVRATDLPETRILRRLFFPSLFSRYHQVREASAETFEWILADEEEELASETVTAVGDQGSPHQLDEGYRSGARSRLLAWLREDTGIFHVSGKMGAGKSTLMKFLIFHPRTLSELQRWASTRKLVVASFFFWRLGDKDQNSFTGLYRSVLFETLRQCPELIPQVFPDAYGVFTARSSEECIEELFFQPDHIALAFGKLLSLIPPEGYRLCLCIYALDEYGEDGQEDIDADDLVERLSKWTLNQGIKILASSRPQFDRYFRNDVRRIRLHELTRRDIFMFTKDLLMRHRDFETIRNHHEVLSSRVVSLANGVFLWADIAARSLYASISNRESIPTMLTKLDELPTKLSLLYEKLLEPLAGSDWIKACQLLCYEAYRAPHRYFNAISVSWLDHWDDPEFPMSSGPPLIYEVDVIKDKLEVAEIRLMTLTRGLMECQSVERQHIDGPIPLGNDQASDTESRDTLFNKKAVFFHRSVKDFVLQNKRISSTLSTPSTLNSDALFFRLRLAELWHGATTIQSPYNGGILNAGGWPQGGLRWDLPPELVDGYRRVIHYHLSLPADTRGSVNWTCQVSFSWAAKGVCLGQQFSLDHFLAYVCREPPSAKSICEDKKANKAPQLPDCSIREGHNLVEAQSCPRTESGHLSLLFTAAIGYHPKTVKFLLDNGYSASELMCRHVSLRAEMVPVWMAYLQLCAISERLTDDMDQIMGMLICSAKVEGEISVHLTECVDDDGCDYLSTHFRSATAYRAALAARLKAFVKYFPSGFKIRMVTAGGEEIEVSDIDWLTSGSSQLSYQVIRWGSFKLKFGKHSIKNEGRIGDPLPMIRLW